MTTELTTGQLEAFDAHYVSDERWALVAPLLERAFARASNDGEFLVLDVGGGNGSFADRVVAAFDSATVVVAEPAAVLRDRNSPHERKRVIDLSVEQLRTCGLRPDLVCFNWVLHHLVDRSFGETRVRIREALQDAAAILRPNGHISVFENNYDGFAIADMPGWVTYHALRNRYLGRLASRAGANTAGVGVCFLSRRGWHRMFTSVDLNIDWETESNAQPPQVVARHGVVRAAMGLRDIRIGHYWLSPVHVVR